MKRIINILQRKASSLILLSGLVLANSSCDSILNYDEGDCSVEYRVRFKYDYNMKYANAFANEVERVTIYAFDENGRFVYQRTEEGDILKADDYSMKVEIDPGNYHLVAWAGLTDESYAIPLLTPGKSNLNELTVKTNRIVQTRAANGDAINLVNEELAQLWHGESLQTLTRAGKQNVITIPLVKNTNRFKIILQQMEGEALDVDNFEFSIYDDNGWLNYDNSLLKDNELTYQPYRTTEGSVTRSPKTNEETTPISVATAEITVNRLIAAKNPKLRITNKETGDAVLSIPLIDFLILTKPSNHQMGEQEYLDRQDEYSMTFFLDKYRQWLKTEIIINGWTIRMDDIDIQ